MKNRLGLNRMQSIYNGMLFLGKRVLRVHETASEEVYTIESKLGILNLTKDESLKLAKDIINSFE
jgi:hypothetical protein